jgi:hypothetical protein
MGRVTNEEVHVAPAEAGTVTLVLTPAEARLVHSALGSYLTVFGHDERETRAAIRAALAKLDAAEETARTSA